MPDPVAPDPAAPDPAELDPVAPQPVAFDLGPAATELTRLIAGTDDHQLTNPTPASYTVATLLDHLDGLSVAFRVAVVDGIDPATDGPEPDGVALASGWRSRIPEQLDALATVWRAPATWTTTVTVAGATLPAPAMARVVLGELVLHGWDLARGTRQAFRCDPTSLAEVLAYTRATAEPGAQRDGLFGPVVPVPPDAPRLHQALGFAGRDPRWSLPAAAVHPGGADEGCSAIAADDHHGELAQTVGVEPGPAVQPAPPGVGDG